MKRILVFIPLALLVAITIVAHSAYVRPVYFNNVTNPIQPGTPVEIVIPSSYVDGFQGLYVSSNPSCSVQLDTWYKSFGDYILVIFKPDTTITNGTTMYLCYGDIYYNPVNMWVYLTDKELTTSVNSSVQYVSGSDNNWYRVNGQTTIVLHDFGKLVHIVNTTISFTIYTYANTAVEILDRNGNIVAQKTYSSYTYTTDTISASNYDTTELAIVVSGDAWIRPENWEAYYREYVYNETAENVTGHSAWMIIASGDSGYVLNNGNYVNISGNVVNGENAGQPVHVVYTPKGWGWFAQSTVHFYTGTDSNTTTLAATIYAYEGTSTMAFSIYYLDIPRNYSYTIGGASYVSVSGGGGSSGTTSNNTIVVNVQTGTEQAKAMYQAMGFLAFILGMAFVSYTLVGHRVEWLLAATASVFVSGMLLNYGGDYRTSYYMVIAGISIIVGVTVYRLLEQMIMR